MLLYAGETIATRKHSNHSLEIGISLERPFQIADEHGNSREAHGIIIAPDQEHTCIASFTGKWIHIGIEPESLLARELIAAYLKHVPYALIPEEPIHPVYPALGMLYEERMEQSGVTSVLDALFHELLAYAGAPPKRSGVIDPRIRKVIQILKEETNTAPPLRELAGKVGLSGGRLIHLFTEQVGIPIRRYLLWIKLNRAITALSLSKNLTDAAHLAGFSDSAHFSRTFLRMFGIQPSEIFKNSQIVQAIPVSG